MAVVAATALATPLLLGAAPGHGHQPGHGHKPSTPAKDAAALARELVKESSARDAHRHLEKFQSIADRNGGHRAAGSPGHEASAAYIEKLMKKAGYKVTRQTFSFTYTETLAQQLSVLSPTERDVTISAMTYTASTPEGGLEAALVNTPADADGAPGCTASDYSPEVDGAVALVERGGCSFAEKQAAAADAGAVGAVIYNNTEGALSGTLGEAGSGRIPTGGLTQADGKALAAEADKGEVKIAFEIRQLQEERETDNLLAETRGGSSARTVMFGAHLDSVTEGAGINDNGSGSAGLVEVALDLADEIDQNRPGNHGKAKEPRNKVRFAWWSAEENGLLGSEHYVEQLSEKQRGNIPAYLNFDMIASPNPAQFVFDGDDSDGVGEGPGPEGSAQIERDITGFLDRQGKPHEGTDFDGRSDYGPFVAAGIPAGGTFTGAEGLKTKEQAKRYGGTVGEAYDPCYHAACDDLENISMKAFDTNIDVIAHTAGTYAHDLAPLTKPLRTAPSKPSPQPKGKHTDNHTHHHTPTE
ncbi:M28 family metallopeptidase [Streptomyces sp. NPDC058374]|uniref:M28 family metallopeptidase n=1 Tax=Streptomyces sp. NPDC058374 TaxID=3346466 RepID=UPI00365622A1